MALHPITSGHHFVAKHQMDTEKTTLRLRTQHPDRDILNHIRWSPNGPNPANLSLNSQNLMPKLPKLQALASATLMNEACLRKRQHCHGYKLIVRHKRQLRQVGLRAACCGNHVIFKQLEDTSSLTLPDGFFAPGRVVAPRLCCVGLLRI